MSAPTPQPDVPVPTAIGNNPIPAAPVAPLAATTITPVTTPNPAPVTTINTANTASTAPVTPVTPGNSNATSAAETALQSSLAAFSASLKGAAPVTPTTTTPTATPTTGGTLQDTLQQLLGLQGQLANKGTETTNIDNSVGLADKETAAQTAQNNYSAREQYYNDALEKMQTTNPQGLSQDAINENVQNLTRQKNSELADLAIIKSAADGDATTAQAIATQKVNAEFQPVQDQIDNLKTIYGLQANDMTDSEKQQATAAIAAKQSQADEQKQMRLDAYAEQIKQNDPLYQEQVANEKRLANGGGTPTETAAALKKSQTNDVDSAVQDFESAMTKNNWEGADPGAYDYYKTQLTKTYGASAATELDAAMKTAGITVTPAPAKSKGGLFGTGLF